MTVQARPRIAWLVTVSVLIVIVTGGAFVVPHLAISHRAAAAPPSTTAAPRPDADPTTATKPTPTAATSQLSLLGLGDSVMAGTGCDCDDFLTQVAGNLQQWTGRKVRTTNNGVNGATTTDLLHDLRARAALDEVGRADLIVITIGANDLGPAVTAQTDRGCTAGCYQPMVNSMANRLTAVLALIDANKKPNALVVVTNYWNVFEDGEVSDRDYGAHFRTWSDAVTRRANAAICQAAGAAGATCVDTYGPFKADGRKDPTDLLAADGDHPNAEGTGLIATTVLAAVKPHLRATH